MELMTNHYIPIEVERRVRIAAQERCGYCMTPQDLMLEILEIEHIIPLAQNGQNEESNLWLACSVCNSRKGIKTTAVDPQTGDTVPLFNPRTQNWIEHFKWDNLGLIIVGLTAVGRAIVDALEINNTRAVNVRRRWVSVGWYPPHLDETPDA